jgi:hypothetical protein
MRLKLISCEFFEKEVRTTGARSINEIDYEFLPIAPHQLADINTLRIFQSLVDNAERARFNAVLLVSGTCQGSLVGLNARHVPLALSAKESLP